MSAAEQNERISLAEAVVQKLIEHMETFVSEASEPVYVEKIRTCCGIGNWNTALKHCLELLIQGRIKGQKTSKGWIFWKLNEGESRDD